MSISVFYEIVELYACDPRYFMEDAMTSLQWLQENAD